MWGTGAMLLSLMLSHANLHNDYPRLDIISLFIYDVHA
jgi:hypothetical protein